MRGPWRRSKGLVGPTNGTAPRQSESTTESLTCVAVCHGRTLLRRERDEKDESEVEKRQQPDGVKVKVEVSRERVQEMMSCSHTFFGEKRKRGRSGTHTRTAGKNVSGKGLGRTCLTSPTTTDRRTRASSLGVSIHTEGMAPIVPVRRSRTNPVRPQ